MKLNRKLLSALLTVVMLVSALLPAASAVELKATYEKASYYSVATTAYSRMLVFQNGVVAAADQNQKFGLIDATGAVKVPFQYDNLYHAIGGLFIAANKATNGYGYTMGLIDSTGKVLLPITANDIMVSNGIINVVGADYSDTYYTADLKPSTKEAFYGSTTSNDTQSAFDYDYELGGGYFCGVSYEDGTALLDSNKKVVVEAGKYTNYRYISYEGQPAMFSVTADVDDTDTKGIIDSTGKVIVPLSGYSYIGSFNVKGNVSAVVYTRDVELDTATYTSTLFDAKGATVKTWNDREINTETYYRDLVFSLDGVHYGTMDNTGKVIIPNTFLSLTQEEGANKMIVGANNPEDPGSTWAALLGVYSLDGKELIAPKYEELKVLGGDRYRLYDGTHYGIMSADTSKVTVPFNYESIQVFSRDFLYLFDGTNYSVVTADNQVIAPASTDGVAVFNDADPIDYTLYDYSSLRMEDNYNSTVLPFVSKTATGYITTYADYETGKVLGTLPYMASNITSDGRFVYRDAAGLMGFGQLTSGGLDNPAAPSSTGAGGTTPVAPVAPSAVAYATTGYKIQVDGKAVNFDLYALKDAAGNDTNYIKLRDVAQQLNGTKAQFNVGFDGSIVITRGEAYESNGSEMKTPFSGNQSYQNSPNAVVVDGETADLSAILLTDAGGNGFTYFKLRDLGQALGFNVSYDAAQGMIVINSDEPYSAD